MNLVKGKEVEMIIQITKAGYVVVLDGVTLPNMLKGGDSDTGKINTVILIRGYYYYTYKYNNKL